MDDIRIEGKAEYALIAPGYIDIVRAKNHTFSYNSGKPVYSFVFVENGELCYAFKGVKAEKVVSGECLFVPKGLPYTTTYVGENNRVKILSFDVKGIEKFNDDTPKTMRAAEIGLVFSSINEYNMYSSTFLFSKIYELLFYLKESGMLSGEKYSRIYPAINELKKNYFKNEKVSYYADLCAMSESNFRKLFKEYTGVSPIEYRNMIRISALKTMLNTGVANVGEAAYLVGFNNMSFFYEVYNRYREK